MAGPAEGENQFGIPTEATITGGSVTVTPTPNRSSVNFRTVTVASAGTPQQGPSVAVPDGFSLLVKLRSTQAGSPKGFVAISSAGAMTSTIRAELLKGESFRVFVDNMDVLWFDSDTNGAVFELVAEA